MLFVFQPNIHRDENYQYPLIEGKPYSNVTPYILNIEYIGILIHTMI